MLTLLLVTVLVAAASRPARAQTYSATYLPSDAPYQSEQGQSGTNQCGTAFNQSSECQNAYINSVTDFCVFAPPEPGPNSDIGNTEQIEVAWCLLPGTGNRLMPDGTISGAHFVITPDFVQVTGVGDLTKINIPAGDAGGELDPHGATGNGNPIGGLVFSNAYGQMMQMFEWTNFVSDTEFCFRACKPAPMAPTWCQHIYDEMGCMWNMPADYDAGVFENCKGDSGEPMGVYGTSTFYQGDPATPSAQAAPSSSSCVSFSSVGNGLVVSGTSIVSSPTASPAPTSPNASPSSSSSSSPSSSSATSAPRTSSGASSGSTARSTTQSSATAHATSTGAGASSGAGAGAGVPAWRGVWAAAAVLVASVAGAAVAI